MEKLSLRNKLVTAGTHPVLWEQLNHKCDFFHARGCQLEITGHNALPQILKKSGSWRLLKRNVVPCSYFICYRHESQESKKGGQTEGLFRGIGTLTELPNNTWQVKWDPWFIKQTNGKAVQYTDDTFENESELAKTYYAGTFGETVHTDSATFVALPLIDGKDLSEHANESEGYQYTDQSDLQLVNYCILIGREIQRLHRLGIIHRDIKPQNIIAGDLSLEIGCVKNATDDFNAEIDTVTLEYPAVSLIDFGYAIKASKIPTTIAGTEGYISPENIKGYRPTQQSDLFAYGCVIAELLARDIKFTQDEVEDTRWGVQHLPNLKHREKEHEPLYESLRNCIIDLLDDDPNKRDIKKTLSTLCNLRSVLHPLASNNEFNKITAAIHSELMDTEDKEYEQRLTWLWDTVYHSDTLESIHSIIKNGWWAIELPTSAEYFHTIHGSSSVKRLDNHINQYMQLFAGLTINGKTIFNMEYHAKNDATSTNIATSTHTYFNQKTEQL